jgi:hypothetical protein
VRARRRGAAHAPGHGTAIMIGKRFERVLTGGCDEAAMSLGA